MFSGAQTSMGPNRVIECIDERKPCLQPLVRFCETKRLSAQMCVHHAQREIQSFHKRSIDSIAPGVLQPCCDSIMVSQYNGSLNFDHPSFGATFMNRGIIEVVLNDSHRASGSASLSGFGRGYLF